MKGKEIIKCKNFLHKTGFPRIKQLTILYLVIETNGENHEKRTDECKQHFTIIWVYKSQINKYILLVKTKDN